jgi:MFS family permease
MPRRHLALALLFAINLLNFFDRQILASIIEPLRHDWGLSDTQLGWLVTSFTLLYAMVGLPLGRLADTWRRNLLLAAGLSFWSALTFLSGLTRNFWQLFVARLGVGIGEASCAPAATSMIGDLYPPQQRARAMSIFMLGLPAGVALSYLVGGAVAQHYGWRAVFFLAGVPGIILSLAILLMPEVRRGQFEPEKLNAETQRTSEIAEKKHKALRPLPPQRLCVELFSSLALGPVLRIPAMRWIILSGLLHNFIMYAFTFFLPSLLIRYYGTTVQTAGWISALVIGTVGALGMLAGGWLGDAARRRKAHGRMLVATVAVAIAAPAGFLALQWNLPGFVLLQALAAFLMYTYYPTVYATIHDLIEPQLRGRAMSIYFFAMYTLGASLGPVATGRLSDYLARTTTRAAALHQAMYLVPALTMVLSLVLWAGAQKLNAEAAEEKRRSQRIE